MTDKQALYASILAAPDDDTPRLVLADYLAEQPGVACGACGGSGRDYRTVNPGCDTEHDYDNGPCATCSGSGTVYPDADRASFIRCQVELARLPDPPKTHPLVTAVGLLWQGAAEPFRKSDPHADQRAALRARERELWPRVADQMRKELGELSRTGTYLGMEPNPGLGTTGWGFIVRRGFSDELRCGLAAFVGGPCERCDGAGQISGWVGDNIATPVDYVEHTCPICSGTGHLPGLAATVAARVPVTGVRLTDREPMESVFENQPASCRWLWVWNDRALSTPSSLPDGIYHRLRIKSFRDGGHDWAGYPTRDLALESLSAAAVALARRRAGLSPPSCSDTGPDRSHT